MTCPDCKKTLERLPDDGQFEYWGCHTCGYVTSGCVISVPADFE